MNALSTSTFAPRSLSALLQGVPCAEAPTDAVSVSAVRLDSRAIKPGELFVAVRGEDSHGARFIDNAIANGAAAVMVDQFAEIDSYDAAVPCVNVNDLGDHLGQIALNMYGEAGQTLDVFAVTGTNGKTSCCSAYATLHRELDAVCGSIGTLGWGIPDSYTETENTTPDVFTLHEIFAHLKQAGCGAIAMEASSHALAQNRLAGIKVRGAAFTNLSRDHLDYHASEKDYAAQKDKLFENEGLVSAVINFDDAHGVQLAARLRKRSGLAVLCYSLKQDSADLWAEGIHCNAEGVVATIHSPWGTAKLESKLFGVFNVSNLLAVIGSLCAKGFEFTKVIAAANELRGVAGRMQSVANKHGLHILIDYAHTPDALQNALLAAREHCKGQLWVVFGCGGDRDKGKRAPMGIIAEELADYAVLTNDNPRSEKPDAIAADVMRDLKKPQSMHVELDRAAAIGFAVQEANDHDCVLVAGKGHENYQEIGGVRTPFDDFDIVQNALKQRRVH